MLRRFLAAASVALACAPACEMPRPYGAYAPVPPDASFQKPDKPDEIEDGEIPELGGGDPVTSDPGTPHPDAGPLPVMDGGSDVQPQPVPDSPLVKLQKELAGDYFLRLDFYSTADSSGVQIDTHTIAFSLARVGLDADGKLKMIDWQCALDIQQECRSGCNSATTRVTAEGSRAYRPAIRDLTVDEKTLVWSTNDPWFALGWKGNSAEDPSAVLPAREDDPLVYDPDGSGAGVNINLSVDGSGLLPDVNCTLRVVQKYAQSYAGTLVSRALSQGSVNDHGSDQVVLSYGNCPSGASARQAKPTTLRFARASTPIDDAWTCPSTTTFESVLSQP
jgi:hypothetical protein